MTRHSPLASLPSVDRLLRHADAETLIRQGGRTSVTDAIRQVLAAARADLAARDGAPEPSDSELLARVAAQISADARPSMRPVFNLTGTVLHTNLGRAPLPADAADAVREAALRPTNVEFDLDNGRRGDRDSHVERMLCRLTGAEAATVVNNNAAAVFLVLNTLALRKEVPTSRGELIEIGGSFRLPDIMMRAGCRLREIGTTNRVHLSDYEAAIGPRTGLVMKVHTSNYAVVGFTSGVPEPDIARLCHERNVPFAVDLGSGTLVDLRAYGLPHEPTPSEALTNGADLVTFSGDKLLGGPQAGIIVGRRDLIARMTQNPLKRVLRVDKMTVAALSAVLTLYADPDRLAERLPVIRLLARPLADIRAAAERLLPAVAAALNGVASVQAISCESQIGSGALPTRTIESAGLAVRPVAERGVGTALQRIAAAFRHLPVPVIGRIESDTFLMDVRCLDDEAGFTAQLAELLFQ